MHENDTLFKRAAEIDIAIENLLRTVEYLREMRIRLLGEIGFRIARYEPDMEREG